MWPALLTRICPLSPRRALSTHRVRADTTYFLFGYILRRHRLDAAYIGASRKHPAAVRVVPLILAITIALCAITGQSAPHMWLEPALSRLRSAKLGTTHVVFARFPLLIWEKACGLLYIYATIGWLPVESCGTLSRMGTRTLTAYLFMTVQHVAVGLLVSGLLRHGILPTDLAYPFTCAASVASTLLVCTEWVSFAVWPIVTPLPWAGPLLGLPVAVHAAGAPSSACYFNEFAIPAFALATGLSNLCFTLAGPGNTWWTCSLGYSGYATCSKDVRV